jgi:methyltransferase-like protein
MLDLRLIPVPNQDFCVRQVGEEMVFLAEAGDQYISLNAVGSFIWQQMDGVHSLQDILDILCDEYEVPEEEALVDLETFVDQLQGQGLLTLSPAG